jgi:hypothetical protein
MVTTCPEDIIMDLNDEKETTPHCSLRSKMGFNDMNTTPMELGFVQYVWNIIQ